jgi:glycolate oxidase subunit GlcD
MTTKLAQQLINKLKNQLSPEQVLDSQTDLRLYDTDATSLFKNQALAITLPNNTEEVATIIRIINQTRAQGYLQLNFVARGAGTGLSGGAIGNSDSIIISLARLTKILEINHENKTALIETGVINADLSKNLEKLHFAPDPSSQAACTIGGNIAENAGGIHCYKYGVTSEHVLGLEVVLPDASIAYLGALEVQKDNILSSHRQKQNNIDLAKLFTGSEGTFGIATKALVKLTPVPESFITMQLSFNSVEAAAQLTKDIIANGFTPAALEMIDKVAIEAVDKAYGLGINPTVNAILLIELDGDADEVLLEASKIKKLIDQSKILNYEETQDPKRKQELWKVRKGVAAAFGQIAPYWYLYDAVVPRSKIPEALEKIQAIADKHQLLQAGMAHAADGNLHPNFLYDPDKDPTVVERIFKASHEIMQLCIDLGGTLSGEHGIGLEKREYMDYLWSPEDMAAMQQVRNAFDPEHIANPDKLFPIRICKENLQHCEESIR